MTEAIVIKVEPFGLEGHKEYGKDVLLKIKNAIYAGKIVVILPNLGVDIDA